MPQQLTAETITKYNKLNNNKSNTSTSLQNLDIKLANSEGKCRFFNSCRARKLEMSVVMSFQLLVDIEFTSEFIHSNFHSSLLV